MYKRLYKVDFKRFLLIILIGVVGSCSKQDSFLKQISTQSSTIPNTLLNLQDLLNNDRIFNNSDPAYGLIASDEYYITPSVFISAQPLEKNIYTWAESPYPANANVSDWNDCYLQVYYSNTILDNLTQIKVTAEDASTAAGIKGMALFFRSKAFFNLLQTFSLPYDSTRATEQLGIPLRLNSDLSIITHRSSEDDCYKQIIRDLDESINLLPVKVSIPTLPSQFAAHGLLARVYLSLGMYTNALAQASAALNLDNSLQDFNSFPQTGTPNHLAPVNFYPLIEDKFHSCMTVYGVTTFNKMIVDSTLYQSYDSTDLRKVNYFQLSNGFIRFKGSYELNHFGINFDGIATDEMYLIRAECEARVNDISAALSDLNALLIKRYKTGSFVPVSITNKDSCLNKILDERKKELLFRGLRWQDLRRLNSQSQFAKTLVRSIDNTTYTLPPGDLRYAFLIPQSEIEISGLIQNER